MKKPIRTWSLLVGLGLPLLIVGVAAMLISFATLIDVARINGLPFPIMFPILIDVGMVQSMIVASQFKLRGMKGTWLAYLTFAVLSIVSIGANSTHALMTADMTVTSPVWAALIAATPPATLLAATHLVMMLVPNERERQRLQALKEKQHAATPATVQPEHEKVTAPAPQHRPVEPVQSARPSLALVPGQEEEAYDKDQVVVMIQDYYAKHGERPSGRLVGGWLGQSDKSGRRLVASLEESGELYRTVAVSNA